MGKKQPKRTPLYDTLRITEPMNPDRNTNVQNPSEDAIEEAKNWVEQNEL